jgi:hypothetical protein
MACGRELAHVGADLGEKDLGRGLAQPGDLFQSVDAIAKGRKRGLDSRIEGDNRRFQLFDRLQMLMMRKR